MLTLADFILDKFGGDSIDETRTNFVAYRARISRSPEAPVAGGGHAGSTSRARSAGQPVKAGDEATGGESGSGGDD